MNLMSDFIEIERDCTYLSQIKSLKEYYQEKLQKMKEAKERYIYSLGPYWKLAKERIEEYNDDIDQINYIISKIDYDITRSIEYNTKRRIFIKYDDFIKLKDE